MTAPLSIIVADDDLDDHRLMKDAWEENHLSIPLEFVQDGQQLLDYLHRRGGYAHLEGQPLPSLVLLDLNMPRKDGRQALREIRADDHLKKIPVVVMSTSNKTEDIERAYELGVNSFIRKPAHFEGLVDAVRTLAKYWFQIAELPPNQVS